MKNIQGDIVKILDEDGNFCKVGQTGEVCIDVSQGAPGIMMEYYRNPAKTAEAIHDGWYHTGDTAWCDEDGYYWITGRVDDVLNVSGHRLGTAEIESALVAHPKIAEAAVVGIPHNIKGQAIYAYVTLNHGEEPSPELYAEVRNWVRKEIGPLATPDVLHWTDSLPKTRSGKIMRRILRKIAAGDTSNLGDTSTLADPGVVEKLLEEKQAIAMPS